MRIRRGRDSTTDGPRRVLTGGAPAALAEVVALVERSAAELGAAGHVEWRARAADLYRAAVAEEARALARDRTLLDETVRAAAQVAVPGVQAVPGEPYGGWAR
ncbi:hypothetical protein ACO229_22645 [Promicromonospora sp. MS192]|uniref:hypothetical protein n=1 Tax=Promicromonospora sp. MS192 TaxID=3412684 RepID=UPI003C2E466C